MLNNEPTDNELNRIESNIIESVYIGYSIVKIVTGDTIIGNCTIIGTIINIDYPFYIDELFDFNSKTQPSIGVTLSYYNTLSEQTNILIENNQIITITKASNKVIEIYLEAMQEIFGTISDLQTTTKQLEVKNISDDYINKLNEILKLEADESK